MAKIEKFKSKITLICKTWHEEGEVITLFDFDKLDHYYDGLHACYRILCGNKFYYYIKEDTKIVEIEVY